MERSAEIEDVIRQMCASISKGGTLEQEITINRDGNWRLYSPLLPEGAEELGTVTRDGETGAYVLLASGVCVQMNAGTIRSLPSPYNKAAK